MDVSQNITNLIDGLDDWRGALLARLLILIRDAAPELSEDWKWDTPVFMHNGNVLAAGVFKDHLKINFFKGAALDDPDGLFNAGLEAKKTRAIDIYAGDAVNEDALTRLIQAAVALNAK